MNRTSVVAVWQSRESAWPVLLYASRTSKLQYMHRKCTPDAVRQQSLAVFAHESELCSISEILDEVWNNLLILIIAFSTSKVDKPFFFLTKRRQPERTSRNIRQQLGEGLVIKGLRLIRQSSRRPIRQSSSSSSRAAIIGRRPLELGIELSLNFLELVVGTAI